MKPRFADVVRKKLQELKMEQKDLAQALGVTEAYISRLLTGAALPPASDRSKVVQQMEQVLGFGEGTLEQYACAERTLHKMMRWQNELSDLEDDSLSDELRKSINIKSTGTAEPARQTFGSLLTADPPTRHAGLKKKTQLIKASKMPVERRSHPPLLTAGQIADGKYKKAVKIGAFTGVEKTGFIEPPYSLIVWDHSMVPRLEKGDRVVVSPLEKVQAGDLAVCITASEVLIRRVHFKEDMVLLEPYNRSFEMTMLHKKEVKALHKITEVILQ